MFLDVAKRSNILLDKQISNVGSTMFDLLARALVSLRVCNKVSQLVEPWCIKLDVSRPVLAVLVSQIFSYYILLYEIKRFVFKQIMRHKMGK